MEFELEARLEGQELHDRLITAAREYLVSGIFTEKKLNLNPMGQFAFHEDLQHLQMLSEQGNGYPNEHFSPDELIERVLKYVNMEVSGIQNQSIELFGLQPVVNTAVFNLFRLANYHAELDKNGDRLVSIKSFVEGNEYALILGVNSRGVDFSPSSSDTEKAERKSILGSSQVLEGITKNLYHGRFEPSYHPKILDDKRYIPARREFRLTLFGKAGEKSDLYNLPIVKNPSN